MMDKSIGILDKDYTLWVKELVKRYRSSQIKAATKVNRDIQQVAILPQIVEKLYYALFSIPWGNNRYIIENCTEAK